MKAQGNALGNDATLVNSPNGAALIRDLFRTAPLGLSPWLLSLTQGGRCALPWAVIGPPFQG